MDNWYAKAAEVFSHEDISSVIEIYDKRPSDYTTIDWKAVDAIVSSYTNATESQIHALHHYAAFVTR